MTLLSEIYDVTLKKPNRGQAKLGNVRPTIGEFFMTHKDYVQTISYRAPIGIDSVDQTSTLSALQTRDNVLIKISDTKFLWFRAEEASDDGKVSTCTYNANGSVTKGTDYTFGQTGRVVRVDAVMISSTKFVILWRSDHTTRKLYSIVATYNPTTEAFTFDVDTEIASGTTLKEIALTKVNSNTVCAVRSAGDTNCRAWAGTVGASEVSWGTSIAYESAAYGSSPNCDVITLDDDRVVLFGGSSFAGEKISIGTITGTTISQGTKLSIGSVIPMKAKGFVVDNDKMVIAHSSSAAMKLSVVSIGTTTLTLDFTVNLGIGTPDRSFDVAQFDEDTYFLSYWRENNKDNYIGLIKVDQAESTATVEDFTLLEAYSNISYPCCLILDNPDDVVTIRENVNGMQFSNVNMEFE